MDTYPTRAAMDADRALLSRLRNALNASPSCLRLDACRRRHGLPRYAAHRATTDAVACAELFLAQCAELESRRGRPLVLDDVAERDLAR